MMDTPGRPERRSCRSRPACARLSPTVLAQVSARCPHGRGGLETGREARAWGGTITNPQWRGRKQSPRSLLPLGPGCEARLLIMLSGAAKGFKKLLSQWRGG